MAEQSTAARLSTIAHQIRGCRHVLSQPDEHAEHIVELVEEALAFPDAFPKLVCLRREIGRLKYNYPDNWPMRALQAIARAFAPGFEPSSDFMEGGWFTGGWDDVEKIANAIDAEADRIANALPEADQDGESNDPNVHSEDFRSVRWSGTLYSFTKSQAACVYALWKAWEAGTPEMAGDSVIATPGVPQTRLIDVFRSKGKPHPAWGTMIVKGQSKGAYRLSEPTAVAVVKPTPKPHQKQLRKTTRKTHR